MNASRGSSVEAKGQARSESFGPETTQEFQVESLLFLSDAFYSRTQISAVEDRGKAALTELLQQVKGEKTPVVVERVVADINEIVRLVRFPGWQQTAAGEREVKKALRKSLLKYNYIRIQSYSRGRMGISGSTIEEGSVALGVTTGPSRAR